jgi:hypothetical protein
MFAIADVVRLLSHMITEADKTHCQCNRIEKPLLQALVGDSNKY